MIEYTWKRTKDEQGREVIRTLYTICLQACSELGQIECDNRLVRLEADPTTSFLLQSLDRFEFCLKTDFPISRIGTLGRFEVFRNMRATDNYILITYNGKTVRIIVEL